MARIKSSIEVALERANRLSKISEEEIQSMEEQKYIVAGQSLMDRFHQNQILVPSLPGELERFQGSLRNSVIKGFLKRAGELLNLGNSLEVLEAIEAVTEGNEISTGNLAGARQLSANFRRQLANDYLKLHESYTRQQQYTLEEMGIRGSAIAGFNAHKNPQFKIIEQRAEEEFQQNLQPFILGLGA
ncbi:MAG: hypothetical protein ACYCX4_09940 [Bacillota bacterium]